MLTTDQLLIIILVILTILLIKCFQGNSEYFSPRKRPMDTAWSTLHNNPYDNVDYITPSFMKQ